MVLELESNGGLMTILSSRITKTFAYLEGFNEYKRHKIAFKIRRAYNKPIKTNCYLGQSNNDA